MSTAVRRSLRDAVFGSQDGLISTLGALTGIAAGTQDGRAVVIAGCVIVVVESLSMSAGSYLSSKAHREYLQRLLREEEEAIANNPEEERRELWAMYRARGYTDEEIRILERRLFSDPKLLLEDMAHKALGIYPHAFGDVEGNAFVMGSAYVIGGLVPVVPYLFWPIALAMPVSIIATCAALFGFGGIKGRLVKQSWWRSGLEMLTVAGLAGIAGFFVGRVTGIIIE